jgi:hypothetical protein
MEVVNDAFSDEGSDNKNTEKPLSKLNKTELTEVAVLKGIEVPAEATKAEIIKLIEAVTESEVKE